MINFDNIPTSDTKTRICVPSRYADAVSYALDSNNVDYSPGSIESDGSPETEAFLEHWAQKCKTAFNASRCHPDCLIAFETNLDPEILFERITHGLKNDNDMGNYLYDHRNIATSSNSILDL